MNTTFFTGRLRLAHLLVIAVLLSGAGTASAQDTYFLDRTDSLSRSGDYYYQSFTLGGQRTMVLRFVSDYSADAALLPAANLQAFINGQATQAFISFNSQFGTRSVTLNAGSYAIAVRSRVNSTNNYRIELDYDVVLPNRTRIQSQTEADMVSANGGRLWQPFTIPTNQVVWIDGANLGLDFYLIPASELSNFTNNRTFRYYTDYVPITSVNQPGGFLVDLPPGDYVLAFYNPNSIAKPVTYTIEWWSGTRPGTTSGSTNTSGGGSGGGTGGGGGGGTTVVPPSISAQPQVQTVTVGGTATFSVTAGGTSVTYQWRKDGQPISGATSATLTLTNVQSSQAGSYTVVVTNSAGSITSNATTLTVNPPPATAMLANLSVRSFAGTGSQTLIAGFAVSGTPSKPLLVRGIGPALGAFGVTGVLADPRLQVINNGNVIATNEDWGSNATQSALVSASNRVGAFALTDNTRDAAMLSTLNPGVYSTQVTGANNGTGTALIEIYDTEANPTGVSSRLVNLSARTQVGTGNDVLIAGFAVRGTGTLRLLIRGIGPALSAFGVSGVLADPQITLYSGSTVLATNDNWGSATNASEIASTATQVGAFALTSGSRDAALLVSVQPGVYSIVVSGAGNTTGVGLVEVYEAR